MKVSRSRYYNWLKAPKTEREKENEELITTLKILFEKGRGSYETRQLKNRFAEGESPSYWPVNRVGWALV